MLIRWWPWSLIRSRWWQRKWACAMVFRLSRDIAPNPGPACLGFQMCFLWDRKRRMIANRYSILKIWPLLCVRGLRIVDLIPVRRLT